MDNIFLGMWPMTVLPHTTATAKRIYIPCSRPLAFMEISLYPKHPRCLCRHGTPSSLILLKTVTLLTHVLTKLEAWYYLEMHTYKLKYTKINSEGLMAIYTKVASSKIFRYIYCIIHSTLHRSYMWWWPSTQSKNASLTAIKHSYILLHLQLHGQASGSIYLVQ